MFTIITDAHIQPDTPAETEFFQMLDALAQTSADIVFLGDIMELWVALPRYETPLHTRFINWCRQQHSRRKIYFLEGNHEFFVTQSDQDTFTEVTSRHLVIKNAYYEHGQMIQGVPWDINHFTQALFHTSFARLFIRLLPWGECFIAWLKKKLGSHGRFKTPVIPVEQLKAWSLKQHKQYPQINYFFLGHFHGTAVIPVTDQTECRVLPPWKETQNITIFTPETKNICIDHWKKIISLLK